MKLIPLENEGQLSQIKGAKGYQVIFKHNTTCPISKGVHSNLAAEGAVLPGVEGIYYLDLLAHRDLSNEIARHYGVPHQSPQLLLIRDGRCIHHQFGYDISAGAAAEAMDA